MSTESLNLNKHYFRNQHMNKILSLFIFNIILSFAQAAEASPCKKALIFGVSGQDGTLLTEYLLHKNYEVHGVHRLSSTKSMEGIETMLKDNATLQHNFFLHDGDLTDKHSIHILLEKIQPDEVYNLAAQSQVGLSFEIPEYTSQVNAIGPLLILEEIRQLGLAKRTKYFQACTSEMFGIAQEVPQTEKTPFYPRSPYGVSKLFAFWITKNYRETYGIYACSGILYNHESPLRPEAFVTRKITLAACRIKLGLQETLYLGNIDSQRDWGYAKDYVDAMWQMMQQESPADLVIATGKTHTVREFVELAFKELDIEIEWHGSDVHEFGIDKNSGKTIVKIDPQYYRPTETNILVGNAANAEKTLHWKSNTHFKDLVKIMISADYKKALNNGRTGDTLRPE